MTLPDCEGVFIAFDYDAHLTLAALVRVTGFPNNITTMLCLSQERLNDSECGGMACRDTSSARM